MKIVTVKLPEAYVEAIDELIKTGAYTTRSEVIRVALRELFRKELWNGGMWNGKTYSRSRGRSKVINIEQKGRSR